NIVERNGPESRLRCWPMSEDSDELWELSRESSHPKCASVLTDDFYWDCCDQNSPFGNDTGADTLALFRDWRASHPASDPIMFLDELLAAWEVTNDFWDVAEPTQVRKLLADDRFSFDTRDDAIIALAFAQLVLEGKVTPETKRRGLLAIGRQSVPA